MINLKILTVLIKIIPCVIRGYNDYREAKKDNNVTFGEWGTIVQRFLQCIFGKLGIPEEDRKLITKLFNSPRCKIDLT